MTYHSTSFAVAGIGNAVIRSSNIGNPSALKPPKFRSNVGREWRAVKENWRRCRFDADLFSGVCCILTLLKPWALPAEVRRRGRRAAVSPRTSMIDKEQDKGDSLAAVLPPRVYVTFMDDLNQISRGPFM